MTVFNATSYLDIINELVERNHSVKGYRGQLAKAAQTHASYLSRVFNSEVHLTPDQAALLCDFWQFSEAETEYFLTLVNLERAASQSLKKVLRRKLETLRRQQENLSEHLSAQLVPEREENIYYSAWYYGAIHVLTTIPQFTKSAKIAERLSLPEEFVKKILTELESMKLVQNRNSDWIATKKNIHLSNNSWMSGPYHINWRNKTIDSLQRRDSDALHYTGVHTLSAKDFLKVKKILHEQLLEVDRVVRPSKEEEICVLTMDWYKLQ